MRSPKSNRPLACDARVITMIHQEKRVDQLLSRVFTSIERAINVGSMECTVPLEVGGTSGVYDVDVEQVVSVLRNSYGYAVSPTLVRDVRRDRDIVESLRVTWYHA